MAIWTSKSHAFPARSLLAAALAAGLLGGCAVGPDFKPPAAPTGHGYAPTPMPTTTAAADDRDGAAQHLVPGKDVPSQWWQAFGNAALNALVTDALARNQDIAAAQAALRAAQENVRAQRGAYLPTVSASLDPSRQKTGQELSSGVSSNEQLYTLTTAQVSVSYTPDLWGGNRRQVESLLAQAQQQRFELAAAAQSLSANLVNAVIAQASLSAQLRANQAIVAAQTQLLDSLRQQYAVGAVAQADLLAQQSALAQAQAALPPLQSQLAQQGDLLAALDGRAPDDPRAPVLDLDQLQLPTDLPLSLPAALVAQRPDVRAAQAQMHAASAQIGVAEAARLPNVQISASLGSAGGGVGSLFASGGGFWSLGTSLAQTLFDGGTLKHRQRAAEALYLQSAAQYRSSVLGALQNVADVLQAMQADARALAAASEAARAADGSLAIAQRQQGAGDLSANAVLAARIAQQQAQIALVQARAARYSDTVALFQALGGGWWNDASTPDAVR
jgi:NodT family efflux transporter outer membrane factor (OMF) lipoprotein